MTEAEADRRISPAVKGYCLVQKAGNIITIEVGAGLDADTVYKAVREAVAPVVVTRLMDGEKPT